ncbi:MULTISPECIES: DUF397 domain-containing protein [Streptomyces]|uniref:DUF397 domain-containing protein n=1 Tax=Streptomyces TaxID=1883 RepID=UPI0029BD5D45|nr:MULTISPECIES: DUF397 domain-containing protein [unclassified Streptomyces]MDX3090891.1 DUF397 domain-containing protein [Streptomyces sp. ME12-02E]MDX3333282.1 DUF397 domain-containing protein [Streptomyces sp. ME02-6978a]
MSEPFAWFKSSHSDSQGGECLEVALSRHTRRHTDVRSGACHDTVHVRDSKFGAHSPRFSVPASAWTAFLERL